MAKIVIDVQQLESIISRTVEATIRKMGQTNSAGRYLSRQQTANQLGVSFVTLRRWERLGILCPERGPTGKPRFLRSDVEALMNGEACISDKETNGRINTLKHHRKVNHG